MNGVWVAEQEPVSRRRLLQRTGLLIATGTLWPAVSYPRQDGRQRLLDGEQLLMFDVACLGATFYTSFPEAGSPDEPKRGGSFVVEGDLYPVGTIPWGEGFNPASAPPTGHWVCRGSFLFHPGRKLPQVVSTQEYIFGRLTPASPAAPAMLSSSGLEGGTSPARRALVGGTGTYRGIRGNGVQETIGTNTTVLFGLDEWAPNFRFRFRVGR